MTSDEIDWNDDGASNDRNDQEDVAQHAEEAKEDNCVKADPLHQIVLGDLRDSRNPAKQGPLQTERSMFIIRMFCSTGVYMTDAWAKNDETKKQATRDGKGPDQSSIDGIGLDLKCRLEGRFFGPYDHAGHEPQLKKDLLSDSEKCRCCSRCRSFAVSIKPC